MFLETISRFCCVYFYSCLDVITETLSDEGFCYTFNSAKYVLRDGNAPFKTQQAGNENGLIMMLHTWQPEYYYGPYNSAGFRVGRTE